MDVRDLWQSIVQAVGNVTAIDRLPPWAIFALLVAIAIVVGRYTPRLTRPVIDRFAADALNEVYQDLIVPIEGAFRTAGTLVLISWAQVWIEPYEAFYKFISPVLDLALILAIAWLLSRLLHQLVRIYGLPLSQRMRLDNEFLLVIETIMNVLIGIIAAIAYAQSRGLNLVTLVAGLGLIGTALTLAAQRIIEQLLSTIVLYLDRPFAPGEYIRTGSIDLGRVESIGLRSTKIRTAAKNTLCIVPNSTLINSDIENVTRGKKVMVLLYLDFADALDDPKRALVEQVVQDSTDSLLGIDPGSTSVAFENRGKPPHSRARVVFFILGSSENSIQLRKRMLELANETIAKKLGDFEMEFTLQDPTVYVDSPMTI